MDSILWNVFVLAAEQGKDAGGQGGGGMLSMLVWVIPIIFLFYWLMIRPQRREQQSRQRLLDQLKKNDRVVTIGGIHGVVTNVQREDDEVTIKVDEASNTKLKVSLAAVARVVDKDKESSDESR